MEVLTSTAGQEIWVGLDLAKESFEAAICFGPATFTNHGFATTRQGAEQLLAWSDGEIEKRAPGAALRFVMEATGSYSIQTLGWLIKLRPQTRPAIINPGYIKSFGESLGVRNKTDKVDAQVIARYGYERRPAPTEPLTPEAARLQKLVRERHAVVDELTAEKNRASEPCDIPEVRKMRDERIALLKKQIKAFEKLMRQTVKQSPTLKSDVKLLDSIPGVGFIVAVTVLAELGDLRRFEEARQLVAFAGLSPRQRTSGTSVRKKTTLCRMGNKHVRPLLHLGARSLIGRENYELGRFHAGLIARGKTKMAALAAVSRKLLVQMRAILISGKRYSEQIATSAKHCEKPGEENLKNSQERTPAA